METNHKMYAEKPTVRNQYRAVVSLEPMPGSRTQTHPLEAVQIHPFTYVCVFRPQEMEI